MQITLQPREGATLAPGSALRIRCLAGMLWITNHGDSRDRLLAAGDSVELPVSQYRYLSSVGRNEPVSFEVSGEGASVRVRSAAGAASPDAPGAQEVRARFGLASFLGGRPALDWRGPLGAGAWLRQFF